MLKRISYLIYIAISFILFAASCTQEEKDDEYPVINVSGLTAFPQNCDTVFAGQSFTFRAKFTDNAALGAYSIDIHHNFDHHSHSSFDESCDLWPIKDAVNPFLYIKEFEIPGGLLEYDAEVDITVPSDVDLGDYHFSIRLTDKEGWQETLGISIKILALN